MIERDLIKNLNGIPGFAQIPLARYLFSDNSKEVIDQEILIVLTPHIIRFPSITADDLRRSPRERIRMCACTATTTMRLHRRFRRVQHGRTSRGPGAGAAEPAGPPPVALRPRSFTSIRRM